MEELLKKNIAPSDYDGKKIVDFDVDADKAVLDAAAYADEYGCSGNP